MHVQVPQRITAYYTSVPDPSLPELRAAFGTLGQYDLAFQKAFAEWPMPAISQAICLCRPRQ